jgi:DNA polymerase-3 subunit epsilon
MKDDATLEKYAEALDEHPDFRVVRRYRRPEQYDVPGADDSTIHTGIYLDTETTGFDEDTCKIIELAMVRFRFTSDGRLFDMPAEYDEFNDPGAPIPPEIVTLTGITDDMVRGRRLDQAEIDAFLDGVALVVAHNASFDRRFVEAHLAGFDTLAWGCSASQVPWREAGFESAKLEYLAYRQGFFYSGHRAINDCLAGLHVLAQPLPGTGGTGFAQLVRNARGKDVRIYATGSPFETKDILRQRGYRWNTGENGRPKAWYIDLPEADMEAELAWLRDNVFHRSVTLPTQSITPFNRFSSRI